MKKLLAIVLFLFLSVTNSFAAFFIDGLGAYVNAGDLENQTGGGIGLGFDINPNLNFLFRTVYTTVTKDRNTTNEATYDHVSALAGVEYVPRIQALSDYRLSWKTSILAGMSNSEVDVKAADSASDMGFACALWTGLQYDLTQIISPFIDLGYHTSFYSDKLKDASVKGYQIAVGIRFYINGSRDYTGDYQ